MMLDTAGLFVLLNDRDQQHVQATELFGLARRRVTHNYILAELHALAHARGIRRDVVLHYLLSAMAADDLDVIWVDPPLHNEALQLLLARPDKFYSLCDAVSFVLMRRLGLTEALTTDHHFTQEGFARLRA